MWRAARSFRAAAPSRNSWPRISSILRNAPSAESSRSPSRLWCLEAKYSKKAILESYVNEIYLGQVGSVSIYGVGEAAHRYFGKRMNALSLEETASVGGNDQRARIPTHRLEIPAMAKARRDVVLGRLHGQGHVSDDDWKQAVMAPVEVLPPQDTLADAPFFVDYLLRQMEETTGAPLLDGVRVYTTLDPILQRLATRAVGEDLQNWRPPILRSRAMTMRCRARWSRSIRRPDPFSPWWAVAIIEAASSIGPCKSKRQPGSLFKPLVYLAALDARREVSGGQPDHGRDVNRG